MDIRLAAAVALCCFASVNCGGDVDEASSRAAGGHPTLRGIGGTVGATGGNAVSGGKPATTSIVGSGGAQATGGTWMMSGGTSATGGVRVTMSDTVTGGAVSLGGAAATGGFIGTGGTLGTGGFAAGGDVAVGGALISGGGASLGGALNTGGAGGCDAGASSAVPEAECSYDSDCVASQYCDTDTCENSCWCIDGLWMCIDLCLHACKDFPSVCAAGTAGIADQLTGPICTVMVRVSDDATQILSYSVACGTPTDTTQEQAYNQLLPMSSVNWADATAFGNSSYSGLYAFVTTDTVYRYTAYFSTGTGRLLLSARTLLSATTGVASISGAWRPPTELGSACVTAHQGFNDLEPAGTSLGPDIGDAWTLVQNTDLFSTLRARVGPITHSAGTRVHVEQTGYLFFVTAAP